MCYFGVQEPNAYRLRWKNIITSKDVKFIKELFNDMQWIKKLMQIRKNNTLELAELAKDKKPLSVMWVHKTKLNPYGEVGKH